MLHIEEDVKNNVYRGRLRIKVYLVLVPVRFPKEGEPNFVVYAAKLRQKDAEKIVEIVPDSFWCKVIADKSD